MDSFTGILHGFAVAIQPYYLMMGFFGAVLGTAIGVLPGMGASLAIGVDHPAYVADVAAADASTRDALLGDFA